MKNISHLLRCGSHEHTAGCFWHILSVWPSYLGTRMRNLYLNYLCVCFFICILWTPPSPLWLCWREMTHYGEQREDSSRRYVTRQKNHCKSKSNFLSTRTGTQLHLIIGEGAVHLFHCYLSYSYTTLTFCLWDWNSNRKDIRARNVEIQYPRINFVLHYEA